MDPKSVIDKLDFAALVFGWISFISSALLSVYMGWMIYKVEGWDISMFFLPAVTVLWGVALFGFRVIKR